MKIGVLCVTFNRLQMLQKLLDIYSAQEDFIDTIVVVDNNSTDGTKTHLAQWKAEDKSSKRTLITLPTNSGGAGGFHCGLKHYADHHGDIDYVYIADDDAFPEDDLFKNFKRLVEAQPKETVAICTSVTTSKGFDLGHRKRITTQGWKIVESKVALEDYSKAQFELNLYSFVGTFLHRKALANNILPDKEFFISYDDTEHSFRTSQLGKIVCLPELRVFHETDLVLSNEVSWKVYYMRRNRLLFWKHSFSTAIVTINFAHYLFQSFREFFKSLRDPNSLPLTSLKIDLVAFRDAIFETKGLHATYRPGWKPKRK